jgi:Uma2 family endonuclease
MPIPPDLYEQVALAETDGTWELHDGWLTLRSSGTVMHNQVVSNLAATFMRAWPSEVYSARINAGRLRCGEGWYLVPDFFVFPKEWMVPLLGTERLEVYDKPVPLVVEVWAPGVCGYDEARKLAIYRERRDEEIWQVHPQRRTLSSWRRLPDGRHRRTIVRSGTFTPAVLPDVAVDVDTLFDI